MSRDFYVDKEIMNSPSTAQRIRIASISFKTVLFVFAQGILTKIFLRKSIRRFHFLYLHEVDCIVRKMDVILLLHLAQEEHNFLLGEIGHSRLQITERAVFDSFFAPELMDFLLEFGVTIHRNLGINQS